MNKKNNAPGAKQSGQPCREKVLLVLLPFWDPQIPPLGLACLKSFLQQHGYRVRAVDANVEVRFRKFHRRYFDILKGCIPREKRGNLFNIGNQVLRHHMMAHLNRGSTGRAAYTELVEILVHETFYCPIRAEAVEELEGVLEEFYAALAGYFLELLEAEQPTVLGLSVYGDTFPASLAAFRLAKEKLPAVKTVMGGGIFADQLAPGSPDLEHFVEKSGNTIDAIIIGEGEQLLLKFLRGELDVSRRIFGLEDVEGANLDISTVDVPDFSDFELGYYPHLAHYGARSCPYQCKFCSETVNWGKYRKKAVRQTLQEMIELHRRHSSQLFLLTDSTLNPIVSDLAREVISSGVCLYWDGFLRADRPAGDTENTLLWRQGGFYRAKLGLESGSQRVLDLMDKRITVEQSEAVLAGLAYAGIKTTTFWLFGFPGETEEDFQATLDFIRRCKDNIYEADCNAFNYYLTGQAHSEAWRENHRGVLLYPSWAGEMLVSPTRVLDCEPSRKIAYARLNRFIAHCSEWGLPNPYSLNDVYRADLRWRNLHRNAVPSVVELNSEGTYVEESRRVKKLAFARSTLRDDDHWL